jgi:hypothetical protein
MQMLQKLINSMIILLYNVVAKLTLKKVKLLFNQTTTLTHRMLMQCLQAMLH